MDIYDRAVRAVGAFYAAGSRVTQRATRAFVSAIWPVARWLIPQTWTGSLDRDGNWTR